MKQESKRTALNAVELGGTDEIFTPFVTDPLATKSEQEHPEIVDPEGEQAPKEDDEPNAFLFLGQKLKEEGYLDSDYEIDPKVSGRDIYEKYVNSLEKKVRPEIEERVYRDLESQGVTQDDLIMARLIREGADIDYLYNSLGHFERLSKHNKEASDETKESNVRSMLKAKDYTEEDIDTVVSRIKESGKLDSTYEDSTKYFGKKREDYINNHTQTQETNKRLAKEAAEKGHNLIKSKLNSGELLGEKFDKVVAKEIESAIYDNNEFVEYEGKKYPTSKFLQFMNEFNTNPEVRVWAYKKYAYKDKEDTTLKKQIEKKVEDEFLSEWKNTYKPISPKPAEKPKLEGKKGIQYIDLNKL